LRLDHYTVRIFAVFVIVVLVALALAIWSDWMWPVQDPPLLPAH